MGESAIFIVMLIAVFCIGIAAWINRDKIGDIFED